MLSGRTQATPHGRVLLFPSLGYSKNDSHFCFLPTCRGRGAHSVPIVTNQAYHPPKSFQSALPTITALTTMPGGLLLTTAIPKATGHCFLEGAVGLLGRKACLGGFLFFALLPVASHSEAQLPLGGEGPGLCPFLRCSGLALSGQP